MTAPSVPLDDFVADLPDRLPPAVPPGLATADWAGRVPSGVGFAVVLTACAAHTPGLMLLGLVATTTAFLRRWMPADVALVVASLALVAGAIVAGMSAAAVHVDLLAHPSVVAGLYLSCSAVVVVASWRRRAAPRHQSAINRGSWLAFLPAAVAVGTAVLQSVSVATVQSWAFYGTDLVRQMIGIGQTQQDGNLDYATSGYPRGLHTLAALASVPGAPLDDPRALLGYDLRLTGSLTWLALALMICAGTSLVLRLGAAASISSPVVVVAAASLGGGLLLTNTFMLSFVVMGAAPSLVAVAVMWAIPLASSAGLLRRAPVLLATSAGAVMLLCHLWQALAWVPLAALGVHLAPTALRVVRDWRRPPRPTRTTLGYATLIVVAATCSAVPLVQISRGGGLGLAAVPGSMAGGPWRILLPAAMCSLLLLPRMPAGQVRLLAGSVVGLLGTLAVMLHGAGNGFQFDQWYPMKAAWFLTLFLSPMLALGAAAIGASVLRGVWRVTARAGQAAFVLRCSTIAISAAVALAGWLPWQLGSSWELGSAWHAYDAQAMAKADGPVPLFTGGAYDLVMTYGTAYQPAVVVPYYVGYSAVFDAFSTQLVSELLSFQTGQPETVGSSDICDALHRVAGARPAVVISKLPTARVRSDMAHYGCAERAAIVHIPGGIGEVMPLRDDTAVRYPAPASA